MKCVSEKDLFGYVAGTLSPEFHQEVQKHFTECRSCAHAFGELSSISGLLASDPDEFKDSAFADDVITLVRLGRAKSSQELVARNWLWWFTPAASALAVVLLLVLWMQPSLVRNEFQTRGAKENPDRWVSIKVFRSTGSGYQPAGKSMASGDALAFTYENRSDDYGFLMVFAVDANGEVYWYFPAFTRQSDNPQSVAIRSGAGQVQLPYEVRHDFPPGKMRLFAVFTKDPLRVKEIEQMVARDLDSAGSIDDLVRIAIPSSGQQSVLLIVEPGK